MVNPGASCERMVIERSRSTRLSSCGPAASTSCTTLESGISSRVVCERTKIEARSDGVARSSARACMMTLYSSPRST